MSGYAGFDINAKASEPFVAAVGKMMVNFGAIELLTYIWIDRLAKDPVVLNLALGMPFSKRLDLIQQLIIREFPEGKAKNDALKSWKNAGKLSEFRNEIAHNPIVFSWQGTPKSINQPPDFIGIPNIKAIRNKGHKIMPIASLKKLNLAVDAIVEAAKNLHELLPIKQHQESL